MQMSLTDAFRITPKICPRGKLVREKPELAIEIEIVPFRLIPYRECFVSNIVQKKKKKKKKEKFSPPEKKPQKKQTQKKKKKPRHQNK